MIFELMLLDYIITPECSLAVIPKMSNFRQIIYQNVYCV